MTPSEKNTRTQKTLQNAKINALCFLLAAVVTFFSRKILIDALGVEFMGLTTTINSILGFLNIAELGICSVIAVVLYKPLFDDNKQQIKEIVSILGYLYRNIGLIILGIGIIVSFFLPVFFKDAGFSWSILLIGFYCFLGSSVFGYFLNYRVQLLSADQRNYVVTGYYQLVMLCKTIVQLLSAIYLKSFVLYFIIELVFALIYSWVLNQKIRQTYPWLQTSRRQGKQLLAKYPDIRVKIRQIFIHKIGGFVQNEFVPLTLYALISLPIVTLYTNYTIISGVCISVVAAVLNSTSASVGNLVAEGDKENIFRVYRELFTIRFFVSGLLATCMYFLISDFIRLWLGSEFVLSQTVALLIAVQLFLNLLRKVTDEFIDAYGLFQDVWSPVVECSLFITLAIVLGLKWGLTGILCAPVISTGLVIYIWKPYFLFTRGLHISCIKYIRLFATHALALLMAIVAGYFVMQGMHHYIATPSIPAWIGIALLLLLVVSIAFLLGLYLFTNNLPMVFNRIKLITHNTHHY